VELIITAPREDQFVQAIEFNYEELRQEISSRLAKYKGLIYTEDSIKAAKADRATLNKFKDTLNDKKIEVKKQCLRPYEDFEAKIKLLMEMVSEPILAIDAQVKAYEQAKKDEKKAAILDFYTAHIGDLAALLPFERLFSDKWLNATVRMKEIEESIITTITRTTSDLHTIADLHSEFELQIKDTYLKTLDLGEALRERTRLEQQKAKMQEYEEKKAEETAAVRPKEVFRCPPKTPEAPEPAAEAPKLHEIDFRIWATDVQLAALKAFLNDNNIKYGRVQ